MDKQGRQTTNSRSTSRHVGFKLSNRGGIDAFITPAGRARQSWSPCALTLSAISTLHYLSDAFARKRTAPWLHGAAHSYSAIIEGMDADVFQIFLDEVAKGIPKERKEFARC